MKVVLILMGLLTLAILVRMWGDHTIWSDIIESSGMIALSITVLILTWRYLVK